MPILQKQYTLEITPEQFLKACSETELQEVNLLLDTYLKMKSNERHEKNTLGKNKALLLVEFPKDRIV